MKISNVLIVGSHGAFGRGFAELLAGNDISGADLGPQTTGGDRYFDLTDPSDIAAMRAAMIEFDVVVLAVPDEPAIAFIEAHAASLREDALLVDIASVKTAVVAAADQHGTCEYLSVHPMFGPKGGDFTGNVATIPVRDGKRLRLFVELLKSAGATISQMTAAEHDRNTAMVQVVTHFLSLAFGSACQQRGVESGAMARLATPVFEDLAEAASRITRQRPDVYWEIQRHNPYAGEVRGLIRDACRDLAETIDRGDFAAFERLFEAVRPLKLESWHAPAKASEAEFVASDENRDVDETNSL